MWNMSKILNATCSPAGVVTAESAVVSDATVLSEGKQQSSGLLFIDGNLKKYFPSSAPDIKTTLQKISEIIQATSTALTSAASSITSLGGDGSPIAAQVVILTTTKTQVDLLAEALK